MSIVAFWSPLHGQAKVSTNTCLVSIYASLKKEKKCLVIDSQFTFGRLQELICPNAEDGISQIFTYAQSNNLSEDNLKMHVTSVVENKLYLLGSTKQKMVNDKLSECLPSILSVSNNCYDYVIIDTNAGVRDNITSTILHSADLVVVNLPQEDYVLENFFKKAEGYYHPALNGTDYVCLIGNYHDDYEHYSTKRIMSKFKLKEIYSINDNKNVHKCITDKRFMSWILANYDADKKDYNYKLFSNIDKLTVRLEGLPKKEGVFFKLLSIVSSRASVL